MNTFTVVTTSGNVHEIRAELLGYADSHLEHHSQHNPPNSDHQTPGKRCSACRWIEISIFKVDEITSMREGTPPGKYLFTSVGRSIVPGERSIHRGEWTNSAHELVEFSIVRKNGNTFIPTPSGRALAQAAAIDKDIEHAYVNRPA